MEISTEIRARIIAAADQLYQDAERERFPTVDQVRRAARADMNTTSSIMKEWRRQQTAAPVTVAVAVPERVQEAMTTALAIVWSEAQELANELLAASKQAWEVERADADAMRAELAEAFEQQAQELEDANQTLEMGKAYESDLEQQTQQQAQQLADQNARLRELEQSEQEKAQRIEDLRAELAQEKEAFQAKLDKQTADHEDKLAIVQKQRDIAVQEVATVKARTEAQQEVIAQRQATAADEIRRLTKALVEASEEADRREAELKRREAWLIEQLDATKEQHKELMAAFQKPAPKKTSAARKPAAARKTGTAAAPKVATTKKPASKE